MSTKITLVRLNAILEVQTIDGKGNELDVKFFKDNLYGVLAAIFVFTSIVLFTKFKDFNLAPYSLVFWVCEMRTVKQRKHRNVFHFKQNII